MFFFMLKAFIADFFLLVSPKFIPFHLDAQFKKTDLQKQIGDKKAGIEKALKSTFTGAFGEVSLAAGRLFLSI